jgi:hypothetical protein
VIRTGHEGIIGFRCRGCGMLSIGILQDKSETTSMSAIMLNTVRRMATRARHLEARICAPSGLRFLPDDLKELQGQVVVIAREPAACRPGSPLFAPMPGCLAGGHNTES